MKIHNVIHKGPRRFIEDDDASALNASVAPKSRKMVTFLQNMAAQDELRSVPSWKARQLTGDRKDVWSLSVTKNWRLTFKIDLDQIAPLVFPWRR